MGGIDENEESLSGFGAEEIHTEEKSAGGKRPDRGVSKLFAPAFIVTAVSFLLFVGGVFVVIKMLHTRTDKTVELPSRYAVSTQKKIVERGSKKEGSQKAPHGLYTMNLAPFIIPARMNGELAFFKLEVGLLFRDPASKRIFQKREAWVRGIIYSELKGINIGKGSSGLSLSAFKGPIIEHLNSSLSPNRVDDIRLTGSILR